MLIVNLYKAIYSIIWATFYRFRCESNYSFFPVKKHSLRSTCLEDVRVMKEGRNFIPFQVCGPYGANNKNILDIFVLCKKGYLIPRIFGFIHQADNETRENAMQRAFECSKTRRPSWLGNNMEHCFMGQLLVPQFKNLIIRYDFIQSVKMDLGHAFIRDFKIIALVTASTDDLNEKEAFQPWTEKTKKIIQKGYVDYLFTETIFKYIVKFLAFIFSGSVVAFLLKEYICSKSK